MKILAYTDRRYLAATRKVVGRGADILMSPPLYAAHISGDLLCCYDAIYLDLHGEPGDDHLFSAGGAAMTLRAVQGAQMHGTTVIATTCHLPETPFLDAFLGAGAVVIGGAGRNWGTRRRLSGAQVLARYIIRALKRGATPEYALAQAKRRLRYSLKRLVDKAASDDALEFRIWRRDGD